MPDYDGRGNPDADGGHWALWIPRVLLAPVYVAHEYLIRRPVGAFVTHAERAHWAESIADLFEFHDGDGLIVPTALFDFGLLPSVGLYFAEDNVLTPGNSLRVHAATWGAPWINVTAAERYTYDNGAGTIEGRLELKRSEDNLFFGIGPDVTSATQSRFGLERTEGAVAFVRRLLPAATFRSISGVHRISFVDGTCCGDPSLDMQIAAGQLVAPPGYGAPYTALFERAEITLDSRRPRPAPGGGTYLHVHGDANVTFDDRVWIGYGADAGIAYDLTGHQRILKLQAAVDMVDPLHDAAVPFTELAAMSGDLMAGFVPGWMLGRSTAVAQVGYTWPLWQWLDGQMRFGVGNAFDEHLADFTLPKLRLSADLGISTSKHRDQSFEVLVGIGTETFEQGAGITSVRLTFGSRRGF